MALKKVKATVERVLEKNMQDLVRGIRNNKENEAKYIAQCVEEIKQELKTDNTAVKAIAICKLIYLQMIGYDVGWAAFNVIEVMSSPKFTFKRIGYLAAAQSFHAGTDVLMLTTNMIRKDLCSPQMYDVGAAMSGLSCFMSVDLARDIANDVMTLMTSSKPYIRKKAILLIYKVFLCYPDALRVAFPRLKERLEDSDAGVQAAAVNVIGELARKNPRNYLSLAPIFFKMMTTSSSNWVLIKIIKLFAALTPLEPRLGKKLIEPLTNLIHSTSAMSLLYECINTVIAVLISITSAPGVSEATQSSAVQLCVQKLRILIEDSDQNLKYLGLLAMGRILKTHPKSVQAHKDLVLNCLDDKDESIRLRALDLLYGMISKKTLMEIVKKLLVHAEKAEGAFYRDELLAKVIDICSQNNYQFVTNFEWYVSVLVDLTRVESTKHGALIASQMLDVSIRVPSVRAFAISQMAVLIENAHLVVGVSSQAQSPGGVCEVFYAAVFLCAEYSSFLTEPSKTLAAMLRPKVSIFPGHVQSVFVHNALKLWAKLVAHAVQQQDATAFSELMQLVRDRLPQFVQNADLEVQERASVFEQLVLAVDKLVSSDADADAETDVSLPSHELADELSALFGGELNPVAPKAQKKVPVPEGLDLDSWINEPPATPLVRTNFDFPSPKSQLASTSHASDFTDLSATSFGSAAVANTGASAAISTAKRVEPSNDELLRMREHRLQEQQANPHYLKPSGAKAASSFDPVPVNTPDDPSASNDREIAGLVSSDKFLQEQRRVALQEDVAAPKKKSKRSKAQKSAKGKKMTPNSRQRLQSDELTAAPVVVLSTFEAPDGAAPDELDDNSKRSSQSKLNQDDPHRALAEINLDEPLKAGEHSLPVRQHRSDANSAVQSIVDANKLKSTPVAQEKSGVTSSLKSNSEETKKKKKKTETSKKRSKKSEQLIVQEEPIISFDEPLETTATSDTTVTVTSSQNTNDNQNGNAIASTTSEQSPPHVNDLSVNQQTSKNDSKDSQSSKTSPTTKLQSTKKDTVNKHKKAKASETTPSKKRSAKKDAANDKSPLPTTERQVSADRDRNEYQQTFDDLLRPNEELLKMQTQTQSTTAVAKLLGQTHSSPQGNRFASFKMLAENSSLKLMFQIRVQRTEPQQFTLALGFVNQAAKESTLRRFEFNVLDTMNTKLCRSAGADKYDAVQLTFQLSNAGVQECQFTFAIESITVVQKLRGSVSYLIVPGAVSTDSADSASAVSSTSEKLDFVLTLPCSAFLIGGDLVNSDQFAALLSSGDLSAKYSCNAKLAESPSDLAFSALLQRITVALHLQLVEHVDTSASFFGRSIQRHDICILLKYTAASRTVSIDGKSSDTALVSSLVDELKLFVTAFASGSQ